MSKEDKKFFSEVAEEVRRMFKPYPQLDEDIKKAIEMPIHITPIDVALLARKQDEWCVKCGECCRHNTPICMSASEAKTIAHFLRIPYKKFKKKYKLTPRGDGTFDMLGKPCPFLKGNSCSIYEVRPLVCRAFPARGLIVDVINKERAVSLPRYCHVVKKFFILKIASEVAHMIVERKDPTFFEKVKASAGSAIPKFKTPQEALELAFQLVDSFHKIEGESL